MRLVDRSEPPDQPELVFPDPTATIPPRKPTIEEKFAAFDAEHPEVYDELVRLTRDARAAGRTRVGMKGLWEVLRWNLWRPDAGDGEYRLNNVFPSRYVRKLQAEHPDLAEMFETRGLKSA